nr:vegetative cell wall protein gp1-like [Pelodiscus sinensis]XP_025043406.1 vegetative cell wall protein gp1-like [Pelodiscus sinensis]|eukprot:XP_025043405.1 vegetative cell wall protein gp1-like [Pelodiscus sinensis]
MVLSHLGPAGAPGDQPPLPSRLTLHPLGQGSCAAPEPLALGDRSPTAPISASCAHYSRHPNAAPWAQGTGPPAPRGRFSPGAAVTGLPAPGSRFSPAARPTAASAPVDHSCTPPLSACWATFSRDQSLTPPWDGARQSSGPPVPRSYAVYSMDGGTGPDPPLPKTFAVSSLERTLFSHLDPSVQPGRGAPSIPISCAVYSMDSASASPAPPAASPPPFPPLLLAVYPAGPHGQAPRLELLAQIDRSCTPPLSASCAVYTRYSPLDPSTGQLAPSP